MTCHICDEPAEHQCGICGVWLCDEHAAPHAITFRGKRIESYVCDDDDECLTRGLSKVGEA